MKNLILSLFITTITLTVFGQQKYFTRDGHISFFSSTPMENIEADNKAVICVLDEASGALEFAVLMKSFSFEKPLMEEHFNENYVESEKFPKSNFKGKINGFDFNKVSDQATEYEVSGTMEIHGVKKEISTKGKILKNKEGYTMDAIFKVKPEDFDIEIPNTVRDNIAKEIEIRVNVGLKPLK